MGKFIGTTYLQKVLCNCLLGQHNSKDNPVYLGIYSTDDSNDVLIKGNIPLTAKHIEGNDKDGYKTVFTASIISSDRGNNTINKIKILTVDGNPLAEKELDETESTESSDINTNLNANREVVVEWEMTVNTTSSNDTQTSLQTNLTNQESEGE